MSLDARDRIPEAGALRLEQPGRGLPLIHEGRPFQRPHARTDADGAEIADDGLADRYDALVNSPMFENRPTAETSKRFAGPRAHVEPALAPIGHQNQIGHSRCSGSGQSCWWAFKDSNLGPV